VAGALVYPVVLLTGSALLAAQPPARQATWLHYASTDLVNLGDHPVRAMLLSAVLGDGRMWAWAVLAVIGVLTFGRRVGWPVALGLAVAVHILATLVSQGLVAYRISTGGLPSSARTVLDVGPSYLVTAALAAGVGYGSRPGRVVCALALGAVLPSLLDGITVLDLSAVGHVSSIALGLALGWPAARRFGRRPVPAADHA
jgi:hypothetical protein